MTGVQTCALPILYTFVNDLGTVYVPAIDEKGNIYYKHPSSGCDIVGFKVLRYNELENFISTLSKVVPSIRYVGWDVVLNDKGEFIVIEGNQYPGVFQVKPSISGIKQGDLPKYKKYMDI